MHEKTNQIFATERQPNEQTNDGPVKSVENSLVEQKDVQVSASEKFVQEEAALVLRKPDQENQDFQKKLFKNFERCMESFSKKVCAFIWGAKPATLEDYLEELKEANA